MADRPNTLVIWGDAIGITNLSCYVGLTKVGMPGAVAGMLPTRVGFPERQEPASFSLATVMAKLEAGVGRA